MSKREMVNGIELYYYYYYFYYYYYYYLLIDQSTNPYMHHCIHI
jgi:hypothetical protein